MTDGPDLFPLEVPEDAMVMVLQTGNPQADGETLMRIDMDGKPALIMRGAGHNAVKLQFGVPELLLTPYDAWRILSAAISALQTLPMDMENPALKGDQ